MAWNIEVTDTYGGEANYCWVRRYTIPSKKDETDLQVIRRAKKAAGLTGVRCRSQNYGDSWRLDICGAAICMFVNWVEDEYSFHPEDAKES